MATVLLLKNLVLTCYPRDTGLKPLGASIFKRLHLWDSPTVEEYATTSNIHVDKSGYGAREITGKASGRLVVN